LRPNAAAAWQLIRNVLVADRNKRFSLRNIIEDPWVNEGYDAVPA
jgi:hypothetical protein